MPGAPAKALPQALLRDLAAVVGGPHVLTGDATAGYAVDWTGRFRGDPPAVVRPRDTAQVAAVLALCSGAGIPVVPQGGNTGLVGGGVPVHGEVVLSLARLDRLGPPDLEAAQVTAGAGVTLSQVAAAAPGLDLGVLIASRDSATVGGAVATNAGGLRVLRYGPMRAQLRGIEAVLADGTVLSHLSGLVKDNTGYDYPSLLAGSEGTLAVITAGAAPAGPPGPGSRHRACGLPGLASFTRWPGWRPRGCRACFRPSSSPPRGWTCWSAGLAWPRRWPCPRRRISCWRRTARARWTIWPPSPGTITPRWRSRRRTGPGCGPTGNGTRKRRVSSACHSSWTSRCPPRAGCGWPREWPGSWPARTRAPR